MADDLFLLFPQWQGSATLTGLYDSTMRLHAALPAPERFVRVPVMEDADLSQHNGIIGYDVLLAQLEAVLATLNEADAERVFMLAGDCAAELGPVSYLNRRYDGDFALLWLDAHGDLNTPDSSPSATFHGMPLRVLLGEGDATFVSRLPSTLTPAQVFLVGVRDLDPGESAYVEQHRMPLYDSARLAEAVAAVQASGYGNLYVHVDMDVFDPAEYPYTAFPTPGGLTFALVDRLLTNLERTHRVVGASVLEYVLTDDAGLEPVRTLAQRLMPL